MTRSSRSRRALHTAFLLAAVAIAAGVLWGLAQLGPAVLVTALFAAALAGWYFMRSAQRRRLELHRPFETSTLAFPPESRFGKGRGAPWS
jgi:Flp pilus assembly protein TadB